jgi:hypothetical protein
LRVDQSALANIGKHSLYCDESGNTALEFESKPRIPSVTTILSSTQSEESRLKLQEWMDRMIEEIGEKEFRKYQSGMVLYVFC